MICIGHEPTHQIRFSPDPKEIYMLLNFVPTYVQLLTLECLFCVVNIVPLPIIPILFSSRY